MKTIILAGGLGSRLSEETVLRPKPMIEIGGKPMLWHIMNIYAAYGINEFIVALGYKQEVVKDYFLNFYALNNDISIDLATGKTKFHNGNHPEWKIHLVDTGLHTQTGGRLKRLDKWLNSDETFMFTYGDGVADIDLRALQEFHNSHGKLATLTIVRAPARFGTVVLNGTKVCQFSEKAQMGEGWINGGYFMVNRRALDYIADDQTSWEQTPMSELARRGQLIAYQHNGFWQPMDTLREKNLLEKLWTSGDAPWKVWK